jgi:hypothetical protein
MPVILGPGKLRQENHEFEASLGYMARSSLKEKKVREKQLQVILNI